MGNYLGQLQHQLAVELFHNFSLIHDDIMDDAPLRRAKETVHEKWNTNIAILSGDVATIQHVKGIGAKTAQRIILELKDKVGKSGSESSTTPLGFLKSSNKTRDEALQALITLGFPKAVAEKNITVFLLIQFLIPIMKKKTKITSRSHDKIMFMS